MTARYKLISVLLCFLGSMSCLAQNNNHSTIDVRSIGVAPYAFHNGEDDTGIYFELANTLLGNSSYDHNHSIAPYARIIEELKTGQTDLTIMFKYPELDSYVTFIAPIPSLKIVILGLEGTRFDSISNLKGRRLAYLRGAKFNHAVDNDPSINRIDIVDFQQGVKMLLLDRVDAIIGPYEPMLFAALQLNLDNNPFGVPLVVGERTPWLQVSNKSLHKVSIHHLQKEFTEMLENGVLDRIRNQYIPSNFFNASVSVN